MPTIPVSEVGTRGIIRDIPSVLLPANAWSNGRNVRFDNDSVEKIAGHQILWEAEDTEATQGSIEPTIVQYWPRPTTPYYIYGNPTNVYRVDGAGNVSEITPIDGMGATVPFDATGRWQSTLFNGGFSVVMNNEVETPHYITFSSLTPGAPQTTHLTPLPDFPADTRAKVIRSSDGILIAGNIERDFSTATPTFEPGLVLLSSQVATGEGFPASWGLQAGNRGTGDAIQLSVSSPVLDIVSLRGQVIVFTSDSIHYIRPRIRDGGITASGELNVGKGILATDCVVNVEGELFVVDKNDIYLTSGTGSIKSVANHIVRDYFFSNLDNRFDATSGRFNYENTFVQLNSAQDEVWVCYPTRTSTGGFCNEAIIWNYRENYWTIRDLPNSRSATYGPISDLSRYLEASENIVFTGHRSLNGTSSYLLAGDIGTTFADDSFDAFVERRCLELDGDTETSDWLGTLYPKVEGTGSLEINLRGDNTLFNSLNKTLTGDDRRLAKRTFDIEEDYKIDPKVNGRFLSYRIGSTGDNSWRMASFAFNTKDSQDRR